MNNNSKVLALKYRPKTFDDLIGQEVVAETITNSIKADKIPNAYLFTGIRGIGKTTTARIVAKGLNCLNGIENLCKEDLCDNCKSIADSSHIDVLEMDAASKTGVDDVRDLIEFSRYGPTSAKYKIFIIDEVHMLSKQAFNALLKTLEEPPEYLKFIFATTEIKKIPITVVSRCQRFDLSRIKSSELFEFIKNIKEKENGKVSDEALKLIVKISEGSVRDALSLLDRALLSLDEKTELDLNVGTEGFAFDNEHPRHRHFLEPYAIANRLVTNGEYRQFIEADGYLDAQWWLSNGWDTVNKEQWRRPLHWLDRDRTFSLQGVRLLDPNAPVCHLSGYEADAYARWSGCRLPTEFEWEHAAAMQTPTTRPSGLLAAMGDSGWFGTFYLLKVKQFSHVHGSPVRTAPECVLLTMRKCKFRRGC